MDTDAFSRYISNTIVLVGLPPSAFFNDGRSVKELFGQYGKVARTTALKSLARYLAVYENQNEAFTAKLSLHNSLFDGTKIAAYFGAHTNLNLLNPNEGMAINFLSVPEPEKLFLLSPPGSPPVGWTQTREALPGPGGHHEMWVKALEELEQEDFELEPSMSTNSSTDELGPTEHIEKTDKGIKKIITFVTPQFIPQLPQIVVENFDDSCEEMEVDRLALPPPTKMPPLIPSFSFDLDDSPYQRDTKLRLPRTSLPPALI
ncbi:Calcipressin-3 [Nowakowskiella sp. JEL0407]|nr:Calcipressin-3 [Nowakowskiella sp. JEL0407]